MRDQRGLSMLGVLISLAIVAILVIALVSRYTGDRAGKGEPALGQRWVEAEAKAALHDIRRLAYAHHIATGEFPTIDELERQGWRPPASGAYYYECAPPEYRAVPVSGGPADGLKEWVLTLGPEGGASLR